MNKKNFKKENGVTEKDLNRRRFLRSGLLVAKCSLLASVVTLLGCHPRLPRRPPLPRPVARHQATWSYKAGERVLLVSDQIKVGEKIVLDNGSLATVAARYPNQLVIIVNSKKVIAQVKYV